MKPFTPQELREVLNANRIPLTEWGKGAAKKVEDLWKEITEGETVLIQEGAQLLRKVQTVGVDVYYTDGRVKLKLVEDHQEFTDGRVRYRLMENSVSEKMKQEEKPEIAAIRGIREELGISGDLFLVQKEVVENTVISSSYPGLQSNYLISKFEIDLNSSQYKKDGYIEDNGKKKTYFVWQER